MSLICHLSGVHMDTLTCPCNEVAFCFYRKMCYPGETSYAWAVTIFQKYSAASPSHHNIVDQCLVYTW